ncbi:phosphatidylinositol-specific phospholipase C/glycerophosphodiester phosphodiesterase family protein [Novipirellula sp.]|uniref:phosphatidylinositol-specific phospholipase C/glycerophosphodiester phosphodiesterase family protein n=1 Tax=Novipirellula sp. TaxID=2795430 RepID=UPI003567F725
MKRLPSAMPLLTLIIVAMGDHAAFCQTTAAPPLPLAHAHNDYAHSRPLLDALDHGFTSVEADIYLVDGELWVAHSQDELKPERTLQSLYLNPLRERVQQNNGSVHGTDESFYLLIDIKSAAEPTYAALAKTLARYPELISVVRDGQLQRKAIHVIVSGNRPFEMMTAESVRYAGLDGRLSDLDSPLPSHLMPLISDNWRKHFRWNGKGTISAEDQQKLDQKIASAHAQGRRVRFWATPDTPAMWRVLHDSGVDMINTDDLAGLETFLRQAGNDR